MNKNMIIKKKTFYILRLKWIFNEKYFFFFVFAQFQILKVALLGPSGRVLSLYYHYWQDWLLYTMITYAMVW